MNTFQTRLRQAIFMRGIKQIELAEASGVDRSKISAYLKGRYMPNAETLSKLAKALGVSSNWLLGREDNKAPYQTKPEVTLLEDVPVTYGLREEEQELVTRWRLADDTKRQIVRLTLGMKGSS